MSNPASRALRANSSGGISLRWRSTTASQYSRPSARARCNSSRAWRPPPATVHSRPQASRVSSTMRFGSPSSPTSSTRLPFQGASRVAYSSAVSSGNAKLKTLPLPTTLETVISPPIIRTSLRLMARPSPVPPYLRVTVVSACEKVSKISPSLSSGMPMPESSTRKWSQGVVSPSGTLTETPSITRPLSVNLMALPIRFVSTCRNRTGSPTMVLGTWGSKRLNTSTFFPAALMAKG